MEQEMGDNIDKLDEQYDQAAAISMPIIVTMTEIEINKEKEGINATVTIIARMRRNAVREFVSNRYLKIKGKVTSMKKWAKCF